MNKLKVGNGQEMLNDEYPGDGVNLESIYTNKSVKKRTCLMCGKMFKSNGPYNRRCGKCSRLIEIRNKDSFYVQDEYKVSCNDRDEMAIMADLFDPYD